jgi:hypothetical protein
LFYLDFESNQINSISPNLFKTSWYTLIFGTISVSVILSIKYLAATHAQSLNLISTLASPPASKIASKTPSVPQNLS